MKSVHRLLRAATIALAFVFALPSCFTALLWQRDPSYQRQIAAAPPELAVHGLADCSGRIALRFSPDTAARLHPTWSAVPLHPDTWLVVCPRSCAHTIDALLRTPGTEPRVNIRLEDPVNGAFARMELIVSTLHPQGLETLPGMEAMHRGTGATPFYAVRVAFELATTDTPGPLTGKIQNVDLSLMQTDPNGKPVLLRLAATPFVLLLDAVLLPIELIGMLFLFR